MNNPSIANGHVLYLRDRINERWASWGNEIERSLFDQQEVVKERG